MGSNSSRIDSHTTQHTPSSCDLDHSNPTTPTPLLTDFSEKNITPKFRGSSSSPQSTALTASPITPANPVFSFPGRPNNAGKESPATTFAVESPLDLWHTPNSLAQPRLALDQQGFHNINEISQPKPARPHVRHLSELIDPTLLATDDEKAIRSPSGNMLGRHSFEGRHDRPLSMRERQERVRKQVMLQRSQVGLRERSEALEDLLRDSEKTINATVGRDVKKRRGCCACFAN